MITLQLAQVKFAPNQTKEQIQGICTDLTKIKYKDKFLIQEDGQFILCQKHRFLKMKEEDKHTVEINHGDELQQQKIILVFSKTNPQIRLNKMQTRGAYKNGEQMKGRPKKSQTEQEKKFKNCEMCQKFCFHK